MPAEDTEQRLAAVNEFTAVWKEFFRKFEEGLAAPEVTEEGEAEFLKIETRLAMRKQVLKLSLPDGFGPGEDAMKVLMGAVSIDQLRNASPIIINSLKGQWHEVFIALNKIIGNLKEQVASEGGRKRK